MKKSSRPTHGQVHFEDTLSAIHIINSDVNVPCQSIYKPYSSHVVYHRSHSGCSKASGREMSDRYDGGKDNRMFLQMSSAKVA